MTQRSDEVRFFMRHVVPIFLHFTKGERDHTALMTTFLVSVRGQWLLFTAGHCIRDVQEMLRSGWKLKRSRLIDTLGQDSVFHHLVPFDFEGASPAALCQDEKNDYGVLFVNDNLRELLTVNGATPMDEEAWERQPTDPDGFLMTGVLGELSHSTPDTASVSTTLLGVKELPERPCCFEDTTAFRWYGRVALPPDVSTLVGMSGGPIFSVKHTADGQLKYWLHAVQSAQSAKFPAEPFIAACLARPLAGFLSEFMEGKHQHLASGQAASDGR